MTKRTSLPNLFTFRAGSGPYRFTRISSNKFICTDEHVVYDAAHHTADWTEESILRNLNNGTWDFIADLTVPAEPVLKPGMRVVFESRNASGSSGIVVRNSRDELAITCANGGWVEVYYTETEWPYNEYNIVEVYEAPAHWDAMDFNERGMLVWQREDAAKLAAIKAADEAIVAAATEVATAEAKLAEAKAARAAL